MVGAFGCLSIMRLLPESLGHKMPETTCQLTVESKDFKKTLIKQLFQGGNFPTFLIEFNMTLGDNLFLKGVLSGWVTCFFFSSQFPDIQIGRFGTARGPLRRFRCFRHGPSLQGPQCHVGLGFLSHGT